MRMEFACLNKTNHTNYTCIFDPLAHTEMLTVKLYFFLLVLLHMSCWFYFIMIKNEYNSS